MASDRFVWGAASHVGQVRSINQDAFSVDDGLFLMADGMGGHSAGEVASAIAIDTSNAGHSDTSLTTLLALITEANDAIRSRAAGDQSLFGMGTTLCAVATVDANPEPDPERPHLAEPHLAVVNVGDSRVYRLHQGTFEQITEDHSLVETLVREGRLTLEEAENHPQRNVLTRALGVSDEVMVDYWQFPYRAGERYVLCSDGLFNEISDADIAASLERFDTPQDAADDLVRLANDAGARDNVTVVVVDVLTGSAEAVAPLPERPMVAITPRRPGQEKPVDADEADPTLQMLPVSSEKSLEAAEPATDADPSIFEPPNSDPKGSVEAAAKKRSILAPLVAVAALLGLIVLGIFIASGSSGDDKFIVGFNDDQVAAFEGSVSDDADPTLYGVIRQELSPEAVQRVEGNPSFDSIEAATNFVEALDVLPDPTPTALPTPTPEPEPTATPIPEPTATPRPTVAPTPSTEPTPVPEPTPTPGFVLVIPTLTPTPTP